LWGGVTNFNDFNLLQREALDSVTIFVGLVELDLDGEQVVNIKRGVVNVDHGSSS